MHLAIKNSGRIFIKDTAFFLLQSVLDFVFPPFCILCGAKTGGEFNCVCPECDAGISRIVPYCVPANEMDVPDAGDFFFSRIISAAQYDDALRRLVHLFKYQQHTALAGYLANLLCRALSDLDKIDYDYIIPVPLHPRRLRERGYNQSLLLAKAVSGKIHTPVVSKCLRRIRYTSSQARQARDSRIQNLKGAFSVQHANIVKSCKILLVDDVVTTGSTVNESARVLLHAGAASVDILSLSRVEKYLDHGKSLPERLYK